jgi:hypothetical protein
MTRRAALATAGAITIVLLAAAAAIAANLGVLRVATDTGSAGGLDATDLATTINSQQSVGDAGAVRGDDQRQEPSHDGSPDDRPGIEPGDDHRPDDHQRKDEHYQGREDDD